MLSTAAPLSAQEVDRLGDVRSWAIRDDAGVVLRPAEEVRTYSMVVDGSFDEVVLFAEGPEGPGLYLPPGLVAFPDR